MTTELACVRIPDIISASDDDAWTFWKGTLKNITHRCSKIGTEPLCSHPSLFHCASSSKCISRHRLFDGFEDCYYGEDESYPACQSNDSQRFICKSEPNKCLSPVAVGNTLSDCIGVEDEMTASERLYMKNPQYASMCDGNEQMHGNNETDETHCESWPCDNPYTRCNAHWQCWNGADELNCPDTQCSFNEHKCRVVGLYPPDDLACLPITHLFDKYRDVCDISFWFRDIYFDNETNTNLTEYISWNNTKCLKREMLCYNHSLRPVADEEVCPFDRNIVDYRVGSVYLMETGEQLCYIDSFNIILRLKPFLVTFRLGTFPPRLSNESVQNISSIHRSKTSMTTFDVLQQGECNRGILVLFGTNATQKCLCPPSHFGNQCQWQNQRVSLTLQLAFRSSKSSSVVLQLVIMLVDQQGTIGASYEQITYVAARDCSTKFNIYLLYPDQPKNASANYSVHIDVFDKMMLEYYESWHLPIPFQSLPVNRLAARMFISGLQKVEDCPLLCGNHGRCLRYANNNSLHFCRCDRGYSGSLCNITHTCNCSADLICVCPLHKFGPRCNLKQSICQWPNNPYEHNGLCIPSDDRISFHEFTCLCTERYTGARCEITNNRIDIRIQQPVSAIFVHFVTAFQDKVHEKMTNFKKIPYDQYMVTFYVAQPFRIVFVELPNGNFYLTIVRETYTRSERISAEVLTNQRCSSIQELNSTLLSYNRLHRVKYYPHLCRQQSNVVCFYDEAYMCLCDLDRFANCFEFNHNLSYDYEGYSDCQNDG